MSHPPPLIASEPGTFPYVSMRDRSPVIVARIVDFLSREKGQMKKRFGEEVVSDLKSVAEMLSKLRYEMMTNKPLIPFEVDAPDQEMWNKALEEEAAREGKEPTWFDSPWLFVECYMYRRIRETFDDSLFLRQFDYFQHQKQDSYWNSLEAIKGLAKYFKTSYHQTKQWKLQEAKVIFRHFIELALWGNKCDLSITAGQDASQKTDLLEDLDKSADKILCNHFENLCNYLTQLESTRIDRLKSAGLIVDNAGFELFCDLLLMDFLCSSHVVQKVHFHVKSMPWYISDVTTHDFLWMVDVMQKPECGEDVQWMAQRWIQYLKSGEWTLHDEMFWTLPYPFSEMQIEDPGLYQHLAQNQLVIAKGDLNYRKLVGDLEWPRHTSFTEVLRGFHPAPILTLRTLKANTVAGLKEGLAETMDKSGEDWMVTGNYAVIQFCDKISPIGVST